MDKNNPPETFGVFKPVGHTVMAMRTDEELKAALAELEVQGFSGAEVVTYSPQEMEKLARSERQAASPLAAFGYELELLDTHLALAESGCSFIVVHAPEEEMVTRIGAIALSMKAVSAQHYGRFMIEDLISSTAPNAPIPNHPTPVR
jgi:hypothetical protein